MNQNDPNFNFGSNLETFDSLSSLEQIGLSTTNDDSTTDAAKEEEEPAPVAPPAESGEAEIDGNATSDSQVPQPNGVSVEVQVEDTARSASPPKGQGTAGREWLVKFNACCSSQTSLRCEAYGNSIGNVFEWTKWLSLNVITARMNLEMLPKQSLSLGDNAHN